MYLYLFILYNTWLEAKESLLLVLSGGVLMSGGVVLFLCCLGLELPLHNCKGSIKNQF